MGSSHGSDTAKCTRPQNPVDLPLRLDDAGASPTTPQGPQQQAADIKKQEKELGFGQSAMREQI